MLDGGGRTVWRSFCASDPRQFCFVWEFLHFRGCIDFKVELCRRRRRRVSHGSHYTNWNMITWWGFETANPDIEEGETTSNQMKLISIPSILGEGNRNIFAISRLWIIIGLGIQKWIQLARNECRLLQGYYYYCLYYCSFGPWRICLSDPLIL